MPVGLFRGLEQNFVVSGDYIDTSEEDGLRIGGKIPITPITGTNIFSLDCGAGSVADGSSTGSTTAISYNASFSATPFVNLTPYTGGKTYPISVATGSSLEFAGGTTGSGVVYGPSGTGFVWLAYGYKY